MRNVVVDILLAAGVTAELLCCVGVVVMRTTFDRLHYTAAGTTVGPFCILVAVLVREGFGEAGLDAIAAVALLFLAGPLVIHATARAARTTER
jgi:monovalent cation/proton antiporter MnhG/PhaG subunit